MNVKMTNQETVNISNFIKIKVERKHIVEKISSNEVSMNG